MPTREFIPFVVAAIGGIGGLVSALAHMGMVDALNVKRPLNDRIPNPGVTWKEWTWFLDNPGFGYWGILRKYREEFPDANLFFWHTAGMIWMFCCLVACAVLYGLLR